MLQKNYCVIHYTSLFNVQVEENMQAIKAIKIENKHKKYLSNKRLYYQTSDNNVDQTLTSANKLSLLQKDVVSAAHLSLFISRLVRVNLNQFLIGEM